MLNKVFELVEILFAVYYFVALHLGNADAIDKFAFLIKMKIKIICKDDIVERRTIAVKLFFILFFAREICIINIFSFNKSDRNRVIIVFAHQNIIRDTILRPLGFIHRCQMWKQSL